MTRDDDDDANDANEGDGRRFENDRPTDRLTARAAVLMSIEIYLIATGA
jgi:hypothetical protein